MTGTVAILGLGLMGGSLAKALRALDAAPRLVAWTSAGDEPAAALADGAIDIAAPTLADALADADLVVLATPVSAALALLPDIARRAPNTLVTDVCSVKAPLVRAARAAGLRYVGAHPLAGSHESGWPAARVDLYRDALVFVTPGDERDTAAVESFFQSIGASTERIDADAHDALMAHVSHGPQVVASALAAALADGGVPAARLGPGGRDTTRIAAGDPDLWTDILLHSEAVVPALESVRAELERMIAALAGRDAEVLRRRLGRAREWRAS